MVLLQHKLLPLSKLRESGDSVFRDQQADEEQTKVPSLLTFLLLCLKILL